jgi:hypothetical protein
VDESVRMGRSREGYFYFDSIIEERRERPRSVRFKSWRETFVIMVV